MARTFKAADAFRPQIPAPFGQTCHQILASQSLFARSPGDLTIRWTRRSRGLVADSWETADVPLSEDSEAYAVEILDGVTIKRTLTASTTSALYTAAQQTADWGAPLGAGATLAIRIVQLSQTYGRGAAQTTTLFF